VHERFLSEYINNDITLLRVNSSIEFNINVKPICVDASVFPADTSCYITGWGRIDPSSKYVYYVAKNSTILSPRTYLSPGDT